ncbi:MAG: GTP cyclohydrolase FolE2 [Terrimicrobiaceae bacterium]
MNLKDTQNEPDDRQLPIDRVGVKNLRYPIRVRDRAHGGQETVATVKLTVDLPHHFKGTHMSRFLEVLHAHGPMLHVDNIGDMLDALTSKLDSDCAHVEFTFPYFIEKSAPVTGARGMVDYEVCFEATIEGGRRDFVLSVVVPVTTLCPCSRAISDRGAHNQRGQVTLRVRFSKPVWIEDLVGLVEASASSELYSVLKRPDEKAVTERAYDNPVFVEDLVRNVSLKCRTHPDITWHSVEAENFESIHNHNAYALIEYPTFKAQL